MPDTNELFDKLKDDWEAALAREVQIRANYEQGLIPTLERDLQAARADVASLLAERDALRKWKRQAEIALDIAERGAVLLNEAIAAAPGDAPVG